MDLGQWLLRTLKCCFIDVTFTGLHLFLSKEIYTSVDFYTYIGTSVIGAPRMCELNNASYCILSDGY